MSADSSPATPPELTSADSQLSEPVSEGRATTDPGISPTVFRISPLIRLTLMALYFALTLPLPFLAEVTHAAVPSAVIVVGLVLGAIALHATLSEQVVLTEQGIEVRYPRWMTAVWRRGWVLNWADIKALKPRSTGQGGLVYYFLSHSGEAFLLPMRIVGFARLVRMVQARTGIDTTDVRPLAQPWMYLILLSFTVLLLLTDTWVIWTVLTGGTMVDGIP